MSNANAFNDEGILAYLLSMAELDGFYVFRSSSIQPGLICYVDRSGADWSLMEDDDAFVEACILYLARIGVPVFEEHGSEQGHVAKLKEKYGA